MATADRATHITREWFAKCANVILCSRLADDDPHAAQTPTRARDRWVRPRPPPPPERPRSNARRAFLFFARGVFVL